VIRGFEAYERLLEEHPELINKVNFLALLVPSKSEIASYRRYQDNAQAYAEAINKRFGNLHWKPIRVFYENNRTQALAAMSLYDVLLVNPLADGMNLVAKEGPTLNARDGVLVLSTRAGAWAEMACGALGIEPEDVEGTAAALYQALTMTPAERNERAARLRQVMRRHDLHAWFEALIEDIEANATVSATSAA
jgi:trehalose 6-phosphate synthase